jgi:hypothetical protein
VSQQHVLGPSGIVAPAQAVPAPACSRLAVNSLRVIAMFDVVMIALGVGFFAASVLYVLACERM